MCIFKYEVEIKQSQPIQLDCLSVKSWGPHHNFCCRGPISTPRPVLDSSAQTTQGNVLGFFVKPKNGLVWPVFTFF